MKIGIVSDTHGREKTLQKAVTLLLARGAETIVHCGDIGSARCLEILAESDLKVYAVAGNMDRHAEDLEQAAQQAGVTFAWETVELPLGDGQYLVATHGHLEGILRELLVGQRFPYVCHGHTHVARDERVGKVRVINPGAIFHPRRGSPTVALLDTDSDSVDFLSVR